LPLKILFACGGTAGHINPALAVAAAIREKKKDAKILFAGNPEGMEARLVPAAGYDFAPIAVQGFQRKINFTNLKRNLKAASLLLSASARARQIIREFAPDVVMGTGGYVSGPVLREAAKMKIKTLTHEQNAFPGVTTRLLSKLVDVVLLAVPEAQERLPKGPRYVVTGNPIRKEILLADREQSREELGVGDRICLLTFGGSLGAERVNRAVADVVCAFCEGGQLHHIHATGQYGTELFPALLKEKGVDVSDNPHYDIREYISDMPRCLAAADLVVCRAGAISLSELQVAGRASVLIPSPNVAENHQDHNAMVLANRGAAVVIEEKDLTGKRLVEVIRELTGDPQELANLGKNASAMAIADGAERITAEIYGLL
jgi:UDP-N-acetylglucosamine--N-acetylmuramyl-(pentapeptide) pyrophosphoryl-undecaprenol N-acetylglucosamine transferase